jgi:hypothetical protein
MWTISQIKVANRQAGYHWFDKNTMTFFGTRVSIRVYEGRGGIYFVTSEQPPHGPRRWSVRSFDPKTAKVDTIGEFCAMKEGAAHKAAEKYSEQGVPEGDYL